eukprot:scaffold12.g8089.t1
MASLKDLAPAEKAKVAGLLAQVVEREKAVERLQADLDAERKRGAGQLGHLQETNRELALENTSLRTKLEHAFELLRRYQHKLRVLDATLEVTGSRPTTPAAWAGGLPEGAAPHGLSPIAEGTGEGVSPGSGGCRQAAAGQSGVDGGAAEPESPLRAQMGALSLLAQALVDAQAEVLGRRQLEQQGGGAQRLRPPGPHGGSACPPLVPLLRTGAAAGLMLQFDPNAGPMGGFVILPPPPATSSGGSAAAVLSSPGEAAGSTAGNQAQHSQFILSSSSPSSDATGSRSPPRGVPAGGAPSPSSSSGDAPVPACPQPAGGHAPRLALPMPGRRWEPPCSLEFDSSLMELVEEVERMGTWQVEGTSCGWGRSSGRGTCGHDLWDEHEGAAMHPYAGYQAGWGYQQLDSQQYIQHPAALQQQQQQGFSQHPGAWTAPQGVWSAQAPAYQPQPHYQQQEFAAQQQQQPLWQQEPPPAGPAPPASAQPGAPPLPPQPDVPPLPPQPDAPPLPPEEQQPPLPPEPPLPFPLQQQLVAPGGPPLLPEPAAPAPPHQPITYPPQHHLVQPQQPHAAYPGYHYYQPPAQQAYAAAAGSMAGYPPHLAAAQQQGWGGAYGAPAIQQQAAYQPPPQQEAAYQPPPQQEAAYQPPHVAPPQAAALSSCAAPPAPHLVAPLPPPGQAAPPRRDLLELLEGPGRAARPRRLAVVLRGLPGAGKSRAARLIREREVAAGGEAPRILSLDDYFVTEVEREAEEEEGGAAGAGGRRGRKRKVEALEYQYDAEMEPAYARDLLRAFQRTAAEGRHRLVVVDAPLCTLAEFKELWAAGQAVGYEVCHQRNVHGRSKEDVWRLAAAYEPTPPCYAAVDLGPLLFRDKGGGAGGGAGARGAGGAQGAGAEIAEVDMEGEEDEREAPAAAGDSSGAGASAGAGKEGAAPRRASGSRWAVLEEEEEEEAALGRATKRGRPGGGGAPVDDWRDLLGRQQAGAAGGGGAAGRPRGILMRPDGAGSGRRVRWPDLEEAAAAAAGGFRIAGGQRLETVHLLHGLGPPPGEGARPGAGPCAGPSFGEAARAERLQEGSAFRRILLGERTGARAAGA